MGDRQHRQVLQRMHAASMPLDSVILATRPDNPLGCLRLDGKEDLVYFVHLVKDVASELAFIVVDTSWSAAPSFKVNDPCDMGYYFGLLADLAGDTQLPIFAITHLNREGGTLGLRSNSIARMILKLCRTDPADRTNLRLDVDGNYECGPPLGLKLLSDRIEYSENPPHPIGDNGEPRRPGPAPDKLEKAKQFLLAELAKGDMAAKDIIDLWIESGESKGTIFRAKDSLVDGGRLVVDESRRPQLWHLVAPDDKEWTKPS